VSGVTESLRRDDADLGFAVRDEAPDAGKFGLNGDTQVAVGGVVAKDRVRHVVPLARMTLDPLSEARSGLRATIRRG
jgi:hypothetical protein